jgi:hypothetical protein
VSGVLTDRTTRFSVNPGVLTPASLLGAHLKPDSHSILPTVLLALTGIGSTMYQYAVPGGDDWLAAQGKLGHRHRHH